MPAADLFGPEEDVVSTETFRSILPLQLHGNMQAKPTLFMSRDALGLLALKS